MGVVHGREEPGHRNVHRTLASPPYPPPSQDPEQRHGEDGKHEDPIAGPLAPADAIDVDAAGRVTQIRPASRFPRLDIAELWHYRELLWTLVWRDVAVRYKQTFLGVAWAILVPAFTALVYVIVFGKFANFPAGDTPYPSLVVAGVLLQSP